MSQTGTPSETPGHDAAPSKDHHDFVAAIRQQQANLKFLLRHAPIAQPRHAGTGHSLREPRPRH